MSNFFFRPVPVRPDPEIRFFGFLSMAAPIRVGHTKKFIKHKL